VTILQVIAIAVLIGGPAGALAIWIRRGRAPKFEHDEHEDAGIG